MGQHLQKKHDPNWKAQQRSLTEKSKLVRIHDAESKRLKFSDRIMRRMPNGQLVREIP